MNWGRGAFRLWLVLSAFWIAGIVWWKSDEKYIFAFDVRSSGTIQVEIDSTDCDAEMSVLTDAEKTEYRQLCNKHLDNLYRELGKARERENWSEYEIFAFGVQVLFIPILLLLVGAPLVWVLNGFSRDSF